MTTARSRTGRQLVKAAQAAGWTVHVTPGILGPLGRMTVLLPRGHPDRPFNGDGSCPEVHVGAPCLTEGIRMTHPDGRRARALLASLDNGKGWAAAKAPNAWLWAPDQIPGTPSTAIGTAELLALLDAEATPVPALIALPTPDPEREAAA